MKRTITELENKIIKKGFKLSHKCYSGKHSQFVSNYVYEGNVWCQEDKKGYQLKVVVVLNAKRDKVVDIRMENLFGDINAPILKTLTYCYFYVESFVLEDKE